MGWEENQAFHKGSAFLWQRNGQDTERHLWISGFFLIQFIHVWFYTQRFFLCRSFFINQHLFFGPS